MDDTRKFFDDCNYIFTYARVRYFFDNVHTVHAFYLECDVRSLVGHRKVVVRRNTANLGSDVEEFNPSGVES